MSSKNSSSELLRDQQAEAFTSWQMPSFDEAAANVIQHPDALEADKEAAATTDPEPEVEIEDVELDTVQPLTLEEVEAVRQDAYNEGFSTGEKDGFHAGQLRAAQEAEAELKPRLRALESLMQQLFDPISAQDQAIEHMLLDLVCMISKEVIQRELKIDSAQIGRALREAMKLLPLDDGQVRIHVNPQDFAAIRDLRDRHAENWRILEDDELLPGGCRVETLHSQIDASIETRMHTLVQQLLDQQRHLRSDPVPLDMQHTFDLSPRGQPESQEMPPEQDVANMESAEDKAGDQKGTADEA